MQTEFKRIKHGEMPGDIHRKRKIAMREKHVPFVIDYGGGYGQEIDEKSAKTFRRFLQDKSKKRQRRRDKEVILASIG